MTPVVHLEGTPVRSTTSASSAPKILSAAGFSSFAPLSRLKVLLAKSDTLFLLLFSSMAVIERTASLRAMSVSLWSSSLMPLLFFFFLDLDLVRLSPHPSA